MLLRRPWPVSLPVVLLAGALVVLGGTLARRRPGDRLDRVDDELAESESSWAEWRGPHAPVLVQS